VDDVRKSLTLNFSPTSSRTLISVSTSTEGRIDLTKMEKNFRICSCPALRELNDRHQGLLAQSSGKSKGPKSFEVELFEPEWGPAYCAEALPLVNALAGYREIGVAANEATSSTFKLCSLAYNVGRVNQRPTQKRACRNCQYMMGDWMYKQTGGKLRGEDLFQRLK